MKNAIVLFVSILIAQAAGIIGSLFTVPNVESWYGTIIKPEFNPPSWVFGPVWITLFLLMGIAAWLVWKSKKGQLRVDALLFYVIQLVLNATWSFVFFGLHRIDLAFIEICFLWLAIATTLVLFFRIHKTAGWLLVPYLAWVSFAAVLNYSIMMLN